MIEKKDIVATYNLPREVKFCSRCVVSNQRPRITFDQENVCSACRYSERKSRDIDWRKREEELLRVLDRFRSKDGSHDVIVPCSGGKDSSFVAYQLKYKYDMNPLTVTWSPHIYTDIGRQNLRNFIDSGFDNILGTANGKIHRLLTKLAFIHLGDPFQPFIYGQKAFPLRIATTFNIPLIMYGEDGEAEYGGEVKDGRQMHNFDEDLYKHYFSGIGPEYWLKYGIEKKEISVYLPPQYIEMKKAGPECHFMGYYKKWTPQENYYCAAEHTGFMANPDGRSEGTYSKYASLDDKIDGFHYYLMFIKFGIGRATSDAAHEIRDGHLTRGEGVQLVRKYDGEFPKKYFKDFLDYCGITEQEFWDVIDSWRSPHVWEKAGGEWKLKFRI